MSKIYSFLTIVFPVIAALGILQLFLLFFSKSKRQQINFFLFGVLAFASIRPNILGESFGIIGPLYFLVLLKLAKSISPENIPDEMTITKARNALFFMLSVLSAYWIYVSMISSANGYEYSAWPPLANLGTVGLDCYLIFRIFKLGAVAGLLRVFVLFVTFQAVSGLLSKFVFDYQFCFSFEAGRGWRYSLCAPGAIFSSSTRLTGFGGEPSIFATYLCVAVVVSWWPQLKFRILPAIIISVTCAWASLISNSTTGSTLVFLALALILFQRFKIASGPFLLVSYSLVVFYLVNTEIVKSAIDKVFSDKKETNLGSITDRSLYLGFGDYLKRWETYPIGHEWGFRGTSYAKTINLLAESMLFGPAVIVLMLFLLSGSVFLSSEKLKTLSVTLLIFTTCLFLQPAWRNAIWIILIYLVTLVNLKSGSGVNDLYKRKVE